MAAEAVQEAGRDAARSWGSVLESVVVYASGALCLRRARGTVPPDGRVRLPGLPRTLDGGSLRARVVGQGAWRVTEARLEAAAELREPAELPGLRRRAEQAEETLEAARERHSGLLGRIAEIAALRVIPPALTPEQPHRRTPADAWLELADFVDDRLAALNARALELAGEVRQAEHALAVALEALGQTSTAEPAHPVETSAVAVLTLTSSEHGARVEDVEDVEIELEYGVQGAYWVPSYRLSHRQGDGGSGSLVLRASVLQLSGEDWTGVRLALSTADLSRRTDLPQLRSIRIGRRQPTPVPSGWREAPAGLSELFAGYDAAGPRPSAGRSARAFGAASPAPVPRGPLAPAGGGTAGVPEVLDAGLHGYGGAALPQAPAGAPAPAPAAPAPPTAPAPAAPAPPTAPAPAAPAPPTAPAPPGAQAPAAPVAYGAPPPPPGTAGAPPLGPGAPAPAMAPRMRMAAAPLAAPPPLQAQAPEPAAPAYPHPAPEWLDYAALTLRGPDAPPAARGRLLPDPVLGRAGAGLPAAVPPALPALPEHAVLPHRSAGSFAYRYEAAAPVDIPSTGRGWHTVTIAEVPVELRTEHVCVPSVEETVYATLLLTNPGAQPLLAGPVEVSVDGEFLLTAALPTLAPGDTRRVGLGVAEGIRVARRTELRESTAGLLNNTTVLDHRVHVELVNRLGHPVTVEVRERVPVTADAEIRIEERSGWTAPSRPDGPRPGTEPSDTYPPSTRVWRVELPADGTVELDGGYEIRIPAGKAILGGNRRN
ncbi:DUF4139 domain-containing protein [Kitasatospora cystarginea]|uniref:DUF4139 domain-containing protein n=1 Tax=Kitasatospora cystarginea TaxID=58350 RepID=UPI0031E11021